MNRKTLLNILTNVFAPTVNQAMMEGMIGKKKKATALTNETAVTLDFSEYNFHDLTLGSDNITLNAGVDGLKEGEEVILKITQDGTAARTITWGDGIVTDVTVTASTNAVDLLKGVFDGTRIIFGALAQDAS